jgi:hypothetical protein
MGFPILWVVFWHLHDRFHALVEPAAEAFANSLVKHMEITRALEFAVETAEFAANAWGYKTCGRA